MLLAKEGQFEFINNHYHPFFEINIQNDLLKNITKTSYFDFVNLVLKVDDLGGDNKYDVGKLLQLFNDEQNNVVFTSKDNKEIYQYECYKGVFFIRINSYTFGTNEPIRLHIIPKKYDASSTKTAFPLLIFKDTPQAIKEGTVIITKPYETHNKESINLFYTEEDKTTCLGYYQFDIRDKAKNLNILQINLGYSYNDTNPTNELRHLTGVLDISDINGEIIRDRSFTEFNKTLVDANYDNVANFPRTITEVKQENGLIKWPTKTQFQNGLTDTHTINTVYHKTLKYFNDDLYTEENGNYMILDWIE